MTLLEAAEAQFNTELIYDFTILLTHPEYQDFDFARGIWTGIQEVRYEHRLQVVSLEYQNPLFLLLLVPPGIKLGAMAAGGVWALVQSFDKIANFGPNRHESKAKATKAESDARVAQASEPARIREAEARAQEAEAKAGGHREST